MKFKKIISYLLFALGSFFLIAGVAGLLYTRCFDYRSANSLTEYCNVKFQVAYNEDGEAEGASLSLWDYRFDDEKLEAKAVLFINDSPWELVGKCRQLTVKERMREAKTDNPLAIEYPWQNENKLFLQLSPHAVSALGEADSVRLRFYYQDGYTLDLPLDKTELQHWQQQLILE